MASRGPATDADAVLFPVELRSATGPVRGRLAVRRGPMRLADLVPLALELTDVLVARAAESEAREGRHVSCRAGCAACCRQLVPLSPPEVFFLGDLVASLPAARRSALGARFDAGVRGLASAGLLEPLLALDASSDTGVALAAEVFQQGLPCPFLDDADACGIHAQRPAACRHYNVTSPAAWCADPVRHPVTRLPVPRPLSEPLARLAGELAGTPPALVPLRLAPIWAAQHPALATRTWPGPELFERFMRHVSPPDEEGDTRGVDGSPGDER